ncbi:extracellular sulfatase SULF-1 homolog [Copidosoma floridanum]|uniref:extracellular sulfatase SULF-1 homolog n=1 Tax=Copidosoma floridanum TaxID=29053 RepID=UPI000C6F4E6D|nr:extracellular sulfatase SULF-1 homolog [Copidosoma floridanum]
MGRRQWLTVTTRTTTALLLLLLSLEPGSGKRAEPADLPIEEAFGGGAGQRKPPGSYHGKPAAPGSGVTGAGTQANTPYLPYLQRERKPNIVLILTDDQDVELGSLNFMPNVLRRIRDEGAELRHAYVTTPMCCPSRSSLLTGRYVHNHEVFTNNDNCSSPQWQRENEPYSFATYLSNAGYRTGYFGKYLNKYNGSYIPPGWREWGGLIMNSRYYNYSVNMNGKKIKHGFEYNKDYYPDLIANDSVAFLRQSKHNFARKPVMLVASFPAPHGPEDSAPQFSDLFFNITTHHTPAYDYAPNPDKQWILQVTQKMQPIHKQFTNLLMTKRLQTLQSVDAAVERIYQELKNLGELDNTYVIYTSDHGYHLGQFGLIKGKSFPFEFDVRVPFLVRGPGIEPGSVVDDIVLNIDLAPTFLDIAGVETPPRMDGRSFKKLFFNNKPGRRSKFKWPDTFLIESSGRRETPESIAEAKAREARKQAKLDAGGNDEEADIIDTEDSLVKRDGELDSDQDFSDDDEFEDLAFENPGEYKIGIDNEPRLDNGLQSSSKHSRLAFECSRAAAQTDCLPGQKWRCEKDGQRWRRHKCRASGTDHQEVQLPQPLRTAWKKCACFTPSGVVYTRLEANDYDGHRFVFGKESRFTGPYGQVQAIAPRRGKRDVPIEEWKEETSHYVSDDFDPETLEGLIGSPLNVDDVMARHRRIRRSTTTKNDSIEDVTKIMKSIEEELDDLKAKHSNPDKHFTPKCSVMPRGNVNCSQSVYKDPTEWRISRKEIEQQIRSMRMQLETLKVSTSTISEHVFGSSTEESSDNSLLRREGQSTENLSEPTSPETTSTYASTSTTKTTTRASTTTLGTTLELNLDNNDNENWPWNSNSRKPPRPAQRTKPVVSSSVSHHQARKEYGPGMEGTEKRRFPEPHKSPEKTTPAATTTTMTQERQHKCFCEPDPYDSAKDELEAAKEEKRRLKEERLRKKERKLRKKAKLEKDCLTEKMNCFEHDNDHWRTAPLWSAGPFCFCMNANNNTYSCLRTINTTHNFLYCEFTTGLVTYYNLRIDPFEQWNRASSLTALEKSYLHDQLEHLKRCRGTQDCTVGSAKEVAREQIQQQQPRSMSKRKYSDTFDEMFVPSALQIYSDSELLYSQHRRRSKKWPYNSWNRHSRSWQSNRRSHENTPVLRRHRHHA